MTQREPIPHDTFLPGRTIERVAGDPPLVVKESFAVGDERRALEQGRREARAYANDYIGLHLKEIGGGKSYSQVSAAALQDPENTELAQQRQTMFMGETLRGTLLNAWGWGTMGTIATLVGIVLMGIGAVLLAIPLIVAIADRKRAEQPVRGSVATAA